MKGKPEPVSFMIKNLCDVQSGVMFAIELQEGKEEMSKRKFVDQGEKPTTACVSRLMEPLAGTGVILHGDSWFASLNTLQKLRQMGIYFVGLIKTVHSGIPVKWLRGQFTAASARGNTRTVHLGDGLNRIFAHAWNEPGWKGGKPPKKAQKVWIANCYSGATVGPWVKERTYLGAGGLVQQGHISVPQTLIISEYFRAANGIDIHNQYRQGILALERTWKTKSWELRLLQTVMGMTLVNGYLAFKYITERNITLREFANGVALTMCAKEEEGGGGCASTATRGALQAATDALVARHDSGDLPHALFNGRALGLGGNGREGQCRVCLNNHALGVCKTCSEGLNMDKPKVFWIFYPGRHGRQCYCLHMSMMVIP
jgi:hypothetical protein